MRTWAAFLVLLLTALAGCSDDGPTTATGEHAMHGVDADGYVPDAPPVDAPEWALGDYWSYEDSIGQVYSLVVTEDAGSDWVLLTNNKQIAYFDFLFDISFVGKMRKSDLAGQQGADRIQFLDFPLHHGKEWTTKWDGETRHVTVHALGQGRFHVVAHVAGNEQGEQYATYDYDAGLGLFETITFFDTQNGTVGYEAKLTGSGSDFKGTLYRYTEETTAAEASSFGPGFVSNTFPADGTGELVLTAVISCGGGTGNVLFAVQEPEDDGSAAPTPPTPFVTTIEPVMGNDEPCPDAEGTYQVVVDAPKVGTWRFDAAVGAQEADAGIEFQATHRVREDISL